MPSFWPINRGIWKCMCCKHGEVPSEEQPGRDDCEMPYRPAIQPTQSPRRPDPRRLPDRQAHRSHDSSDKSSRPTILLVPQNRQHDLASDVSRSSSVSSTFQVPNEPGEILATPASQQRSGEDEPPSTPNPTPHAPHAKKHANAQVQSRLRKPNCLNSDLYKPDDLLSN